VASSDEPLLGFIAIDKIIKSGSWRSKRNPYEIPPRTPCPMNLPNESAQ
jgi:hypothetical protein